MKLTAATVITLLHQSSAFAPGALTRPTSSRSNKFTHSAIVDPSILADAHQHVDTLTNFFSSVMISDANTIADVATSVASVATATVAPAVSAVVDAVPDAAADVAAAGSNNGWFGFLEGPIEFLVVGIHGLLGSVGLTSNTWGISIISMTVLIKLATYPLTVQQTTSTTKMQSLQPTIKDIQAKYQSNPEVMNQKIAAIYEENKVNPLAGCLPVILTIPVFIGLYRAVLTLANNNQLDEPFLWLPNLEGPTYGADPGSASNWLFQGWVDGVPSLGWENTLAFLTIPVILIVSQSVSMNMMATKDQEQPAFVKFLPLMIGYFSLNVPAALGIYWIANNIITTALTLQIRSSIKASDPVLAGGGSAAVSEAIDVPSTFTPAPMREKPSGFGASDWDGDAITPITPVDAEVIESSTEEVVTTSATTSKKKKRGGKKNKKKRKN